VNLETIGIIASIAGAILGAIGVLLYLWQKGQRGSHEVQASHHSVPAGRDITGQMATGDQSNVAGTAGVQSTGPTTIYQGLQAVDHDLLVRIHESLGELKEGILAPPPGSAPLDTEALAAEATPDTERLLAEALDLQRQHMEREAIERLLTAYDMEMPPEAKAQLHLMAGNGFFRLSELEEAEGHYQQALTAAREAQDKDTEAAALGNLGLVYADRGELEKAQEYHKRALAIDEETGDKLGQAAALGNLGLVYRHRGELGKAQEHHQRALVLHEEFGDKLGRAIQLGNLGLVYAARGDLEKAEEHYRRALEMLEEIGDKLGWATQIGNLGNVYFQRGDLAAAEEYHQKALAIDREVGNRTAEAQNLTNLGNVCANRDEFETAVEYYNNALAIHEETGYLLGQATNLGNLGVIAAEGGDIDGARQLLRRAAELYKQASERGEAPEIVAASICAHLCQSVAILPASTVN